MPFHNSLNTEQLAAVSAPDGPVLVLAGAGTGKTRTLVHRVAYLVESGVRPDRILLLTFTNRAAKEMLERTRLLVHHDVSDLWGGTFHHMANRLLRRHADQLGYPHNFTILDRDDAVSLLRRCIRSAKLPPREFPKPEVLLAVNSMASNLGTSAASLLQTRYSQLADFGDDVLRVLNAYTKEKLTLGAMDFDDLLVNGLRLFREHAALLQRYQEQFQHTLVDEYQDTNPIQSEWVDRIAARNRNLFVVGDDFQSIYAWRGADCRNILSFPTRYPDAKVFLLETNYRNVPEILNVANACIAGNPEQFQKILRSTKPHACRPVCVRPRDADQQSRYVVELIPRLVTRYGAGNVTVLYRAHSHAMELQLHLTRANIGYVVTSGMRFFEQAHVKDLCALPRLLANPDDALAFHRLLQLLPKVGEHTAGRILDKLGGRFDLTIPGTLATLRGALPAAARELWKPIETLCAMVAADPAAASPAEVLRSFFEEMYDEYARTAFEDYRRRADDLKELIAFTQPFATLRDFLSAVALQTNTDSAPGSTSDADIAAGGELVPTVRLSTIHQAKGLEWDAVIMLWMTEGMFPSPRALTEDGGNEAEERRLFYVACTRARSELYLCAPEVRRGYDGSLAYAAPSRFLREIPEGLIEARRTPF
ncbi:MAG: ATP-dependent helicase [bacterium]